MGEIGDNGPTGTVAGTWATRPDEPAHPTTMTTEITVTRDSSVLTGTAKLFFEKVKNEQAAPGEDYPYAKIVTIDGTNFIGFDTDLPESREPWQAGDWKFRRDTVLEVTDDLGTMTGALPEDVDTVNGIIDAMA